MVKDVKEVNVKGTSENMNIKFDININKIQYTMGLRYTPLLKLWTLDISRSNVAIFNGIRLVKGGNLLASYSDEFVKFRNKGELFGSLYITGDEPNLDNLGNSSHLIWVSP